MILGKRLCSLAPLLLVLFFQAVPFLCASSSTSNDCSPLAAPLHVAIRNITLPNQLVKRGLAVQIGKPPQSLAFMPTVNFNNTLVYDASTSCDKSKSMLQCSAQHGGFFDPGTSSTWSQASSYSALDLPIEEKTKVYQNTWGTDQLLPNSTLTMPEFPISIEKVEDEGFSMLGLGSNSTFVKSLFDAGTIASKTWSLAWGWSGITAAHQMDGNLVLGGYDAAKSQGPNTTLPLVYHSSCPSGLVFTVTDIILNLKNGSNPSILGSGRGSAMQACIEPAHPLITIPEQVYNKFVAIGGGVPYNRSTGNAFWGMNFEAKGVYDGDLSFQLSNEVTIRIPNHQLVVPDYSTNALGQYEIGNSSVREVLLYSLEDVNQNDFPLFGQAFMSSAYLNVDLDNGVFSLASYKATSESDIVPLSPSGCRAATSVPTNTTSSVASGVPEASSISSSSASHHTSSKTGLIAGIVIGVFIAALIIASLILWHRRKRARREHQQRILASVDKKVSDPRLSNPFFYNPELPSDNHPPQELPIEKNQPVSLSPYELPGKNSPLPAEMDARSLRNT